MSGFSVHSGTTAVYAADNVDTDRIIPARFLSMVTKSGYGELLFHDVRGIEFPLDQPSAKGASVLVVGTNFGCGSSREHAVWALQQAGFVAVIARRESTSPGYSDIFRQNSANCGLLLIDLDPDAFAPIAAAGTGATVSIDLERQTVSIEDRTATFEVAPATKAQLLAGRDLIDTTLEFVDQIGEYEASSRTFVPIEAHS